MTVSAEQRADLAAAVQQCIDDGLVPLPRRSFSDEEREVFDELVAQMIDRRGDDDEPSKPVTLTDFDENVDPNWDLDQLGSYAVREEKWITHVARLTAVHVRRLGHALTIVKERLPHGQFEPWLADHGINTTLASRSRRLYKATEDCERLLDGYGLMDAYYRFDVLKKSEQEESLDGDNDDPTDDDSDTDDQSKGGGTEAGSGSDEEGTVAQNEPPEATEIVTENRPEGEAPPENDKETTGEPPTITAVKKEGDDKPPSKEDLSTLRGFLSTTLAGLDSYCHAAHIEDDGASPGYHDLLDEIVAKITDLRKRIDNV